MHFSLHSLGQPHENTLTYFRLHADRTELLSPFYANTTTALEAIKQLIFRLRSSDEDDYVVRGEDGQYALNLFNQQAPAVGSSSVFEKENTARSTIELWREAARSTTFPVKFWELDEEIPELNSLKDLDLSETDQNYKWRETDATLLRLGDSTISGFIPKAGLQANLLRKPCESIFNALQPSLSTDFPLFLGRKDEVKEVYGLLQENNLLLLYGEARVGKTSLLQCGLANRIEKNGDQIIVIRRSDRPILATFSDLIRNATASTEDDAGDGASPLALALKLEQESSQNIYLVFDQLEQLFVSDKAEEERADFFKLVRELTEVEGGCFRVVLSLRETMLAPFADYETELPALLDNRYRLLPVKESVMRKASVNLLDLLQAKNLLDIDKPEGVSQKVCQRLANDKGDVPVHCLQIYLHQLHQKSCQETEPGNPVPFTEELVDKMGPPALLIDEYISRHISDLKARQNATKDVIEHAVLHREIQELESSRLQCGCEENNQKAVAAVAAAPVPVVIPWWIIAPLVALPLLLFGYWWFNDVPPPPTACELAEADDSCLAYVNYLCTYGDTTDCADSFKAKLRQRNCDIWLDYQQTMGTGSCERYEQFYQKYLEQDVCMDQVRARLMELSCPIVRDTFERRDTTLQTKVIYREQPAVYGQTPVISNDYKQEGDYLLKPVGPVFITTDPVRGGPHVWNKALNACTANGFRLPCIGEIEYLLEKIYGGDPKKAYNMLTGTGETYLVNPNDIDGSMKFWTATEADDNMAWTYSFNAASKTIEYQHDTYKNTALPCLCFEDRPEVKGSSKPPCYQKSIRIPD